jgi:hypothetical protein
MATLQRSYFSAFPSTMKQSNGVTQSWIWLVHKEQCLCQSYLIFLPLLVLVSSAPLAKFIFSGWYTHVQLIQPWI